MKTPITSKLLFIALAAILILPAAAAAAGESATIHGKIVDRRCLSEDATGKIDACPIDKADPRNSGNNEYLLMTTDSVYYFLPNVPRSLKENVVNTPVVVTGKVYPEYQSLIVHKITEDGKLLWCKRDVILDTNVLYPVPVPDLCAY